MMRMLQPRNINRARENSSNIQVYYNQFPLEDILDVLYPLFNSDYIYNDFIDMINASEHILCAYDEKQRRCVGCAILNNTGTRGGLYLKLFGVRKSAQHSGIGTILLRAVIQWARQTNYLFIYLHVHVKNVKAIGLYEKVGFKKHDYLPDFYINTSKKTPDAFRMILSLR